MKAPKGYEVAPDGVQKEASWMVAEAAGSYCIPVSMESKERDSCLLYFRPIAKPPAKCRHERCYCGCDWTKKNKHGVYPAFRWCPDCGSFFHPTRGKWLKAGAK
jgi:hypothetical protein